VEKKKGSSKFFARYGNASCGKKEAKAKQKSTGTIVPSLCTNRKKSRMKYHPGRPAAFPCGVREKKPRKKEKRSRVFQGKGGTKKKNKGFYKASPNMEA